MVHRTYVLTIPLVDEESLLGCRTLVEILLRRRSDGPIIVRDRDRQSTEPLLIQATFADRESLDCIKGELRRSVPCILMEVRQERRRSPSRADPPCSCVLLSIQGNRPCYFYQETCLRHGGSSSLAVSGALPGRVLAPRTRRAQSVVAR